MKHRNRFEDYNPYLLSIDEGGSGEDAGGGGGTSTPGEGGETDGDTSSGETGGFESMVGGLPEDVRTHGDITRYTDFEAMARGLISVNKMVGADKIAVPTKHSTDEERRAVFEKLGAPAKAEGYEFIAKRKDGSNAKTEPEVATAFKEKAFELGLTQDQAQNIYQWVHSAQEDAGLGYDEIRQKGENALRESWGNKYEENLQRAQNVVRKFGDETTIAAMESGWGNDPYLLHFLNNIGIGMSESGTPGEGDSGFAASQQDLEKQIKVITNDMKGPYWDKKHPGHLAAVTEVNNLYSKMAGNETLFTVERAAS